MPYTPGSQEGLPEAALRRLQEMRGQGPKPRLFTSDLSVNEFLLVRQAGFDPLGLVMGSSIYHIGIQIPGTFQNMEMDVLTQAMYHARELAMTRMEEEADQLGGDGVVGVRLNIRMYEWGEDMAEFTAIGTSVRHREGALHRAPSGRPFTSHLSGQEFATLGQAGGAGCPVTLPSAWPGVRTHPVRRKPLAASELRSHAKRSRGTSPC